MKLTKKDILFLTTIFVVGLFFCFYRLADHYQYNYDQERDYFAIKEMIEQKKPILIGPRVVSAAGFFLGPWYYYALVPFYLIFNANPLFGAYMAGIITILTSVLIYFFIRKKSTLVGL